MAKKKDEGHEETEDVLKEIEKRITKEYEQAEREIAEKLDDYMRRFEIKDQLKKQAVLNGQITEAEYEQWRLGQVMMGQRWSDMRDTIADDLTNTAQIAKDIANGYMPDVYAINHNYGTYQVEKMAHVNTSYTLYSRDSVARLFNDDLEFYKKAGKSTLAKINAGKQKAWDKKIVQSVMTQSLLQGESIGKIATRLSKAVGETDRKASIRNARTMTTGIQNAGRIDSYKRAKDMGIEMEQEWLATLDGRTRHQHRQLDGQRVPVGEKFKIDGYELAYPADPSAPAYLVYNCRCTTVPAIKGFAPDADDLSLRNTNHMEEGSYEEWKNAHASHSDPITKQDEIAENMKRAYGAEYRGYRLGTDKMASKIKNDWSATTPQKHSKDKIDYIRQYASDKNVNIENLSKFDGDVDLLISEIDTIEKYMKELPTSRKVTLTVSVLNDEDFGVTHNITIGLSQKAMRNRAITESNLTSEVGKFASSSAEGIAAHEYGHVYSRINGINGLDVARQAYYNTYRETLDDNSLIEWLEQNISTYSTERNGKEIVSEVLAKDVNERNTFTEEFIKELRRRSVK